MSSSSSNNGGRKRSRWGGGNGAAESRISDDDAVRALMESAQAREDSRRCQSWRNGKGGGGHQRASSSSSSSRPSHNHRRRNNDGKQQPEDGHYGPSSSSSSRRDRSSYKNNDEYYGPQQDEDKNNDDDDEVEKKKKKHKPDFGLSGALSKDTQHESGNIYKGVQLKFREPPEARAPNTLWRLYVYKQNSKDLLETLHISRQSAYLMGRNTDICDIPLLHASCSTQHAVIQYRALPNPTTGKLQCQPYLMDLESTNGSFLNNIQVEGARYYQLKKGDVLRFGASTREYVLLTANTTSI